MYYNCRSLLPKVDELVAVCSTYHPDVVCLVETWLSDNIIDSELCIPGYTMVRLDRNGHGGGVALYIHSSITYKVILSGPNMLELIVVSLVRNHCTLCLGIFYRPPSTPYYIFDVVCLVETWLSDNIIDSELCRHSWLYYG